MKKLDQLVRAVGIPYWDTRNAEVLLSTAPELADLAASAREIEGMIVVYNRQLAAKGFQHRLKMEAECIIPEIPRPDGALTIEFIIYLLEQEFRQTLVRGFEDPHSYRGKYDCLALVPRDQPMTVEALIALLKGTLGETFSGHNGGLYQMGDETKVYISRYQSSDGGKPFTSAELFL